MDFVCTWACAKACSAFLVRLPIPSCKFLPIAPDAMLFINPFILQALHVSPVEGNTKSSRNQGTEDFRPFLITVGNAMLCGHFAKGGYFQCGKLMGFIRGVSWGGGLGS